MQFSHIIKYSGPLMIEFRTMNRLPRMVGGVAQIFEFKNENGETQYLKVYRYSEKKKNRTLITINSLKNGLKKPTKN